MAVSRKKFLYEIGTKGAKKAKKDLGGVDKSLKRMSVSTAGLQRSVGVLRNKLLLLTFATAGIVSILRTVTKNFIEQERAVTKLEAVLKSTNEVAGLTSKELQVLAAGLQKVTIFGDEAIITAQSLLLTFTQIGRDVFPEAIETILNMSTAMGTDLQSNVIQLGKALNDPILGISALSRVGIQFTEVQKEQIKLFAEQGDKAAAQKIILGELETQFGGLARAMTDTTEGALKQMSNAFGDMTEVIGEGLSPVIIELAKTLTPLFENLSFVIRAAFGNLTELEEIQRKISKLETPRGSEIGLIFERLLGKPQKVKDAIAELRTELEELFRAGAEETSEDEDMFDLDMLNDVKVIISEISREFTGLEDAIIKINPVTQTLFDSINGIAQGLIQATIHGQKFGEAMVAALKAIAAEILAEIAIYTIARLLNIPVGALSGGGQIGGGFINAFQSIGSGGTTSATPWSGSVQSGGNQGATFVFPNVTFIGTDERMIVDNFVPILNRALANN